LSSGKPFYCTKQSGSIQGEAFFFIYNMAYLNIETKARCTEPGFVKNYLLDNKSQFKRIDEQLILTSMFQMAG
jgi:hypothetical protein